MPDPHDSSPEVPQPRVLDQPWRIWASVAVVGIVLSGIVLGLLIIPVVQGRSAGIGGPAPIHKSYRSPRATASSLTES